MAHNPDFATSAAQTSQAMGGQAHAGVDRVTGMAHQAIDRVAGTASQAAERVGSMSREWMHAGDEWAETARGYVRDHPLAALGIAVSVGYLLSRLLSR